MRQLRMLRFVDLPVWAEVFSDVYIFSVYISIVADIFIIYSTIVALILCALHIRGLCSDIDL